MWLKYGADTTGNIISIENSGRGKPQLNCIYCGGYLIAKKGNIKEHHFAHTQETCRSVSQRIKSNFPSLPLYDNFHIQLAGKELEALKVLWKQYGCSKHPILKDLINLKWVFKKLLEQKNEGYYFTDLGKIPLGALSISGFIKIQETLMMAELDKLERAVHLAEAASLCSLPEKLGDLKIYKAQLKRILSSNLYLLVVQADGQTFHKIGVTSRPIQERLSEINYDLSQHFSNVTLNLLGTWQHRANVELYFKYRYKRFNFPIGSLTEYFKFATIDPILKELQRMPPKIMSEVELRVFL